MRKITFLLTLQILSFFSTIHSQDYELSVDRHAGATALNIGFNFSDVSSEKLIYSKINFGYNIIDEKYKYKGDPNANMGFDVYDEDTRPKIDYFNLAYVLGMKYNYLLNLPTNIDIRTGFRASAFQGLFAELEGVYLIGETFGIILRGGYRVSKLVSLEESAEALGAFDGAFFGAAITF